MFKLSNKILAVFATIIISGSLIMVVAINHTTKTGYRTFIDENEKVFANTIIPSLSEFYKENKSWDGIETIIQIPRPRMGMGLGMDRGRRVFEMPMFVITDSNGKMVFDINNGWHNENSIRDVKQYGIEIKVDRDIVGYLLLNPYENVKLTREEVDFLNNVTKIIIIVSIFILIISILFSYLLSRHLTQPVRDLCIAANKMEKGDYSSRVEIKGNDELSELSKAFNGMASSIENNDKWRKQIIADSAHELRTPVTLIQGNLELILEGIYKADKKNIETIYNETVTLSKLIKELQVLSSAESGSMKLTLQEIEAEDLIKESLESFKADCEKKNIQLLKEIGTDLNKIIGDWQKLKQVIANIISNALRYTPVGGNIKVSINNINNKTVIAIEDNGSGIEKKDLDKIFERFYRTDSSRNRDSGGSGLGLSISKEIIRMHNGKIYAESVVDQFTRIVIELPA